jgi:glycosyltransferase involved in cell wall biosynthesis
VRWSARPAYDTLGLVEEVLAMDIGLFPLFSVEESRARGTTKAALYMAGEAVAVCSDLPGMRDLVEDGVNGMLADSAQAWHDKLDRLVRDATLRREMAAKGLATVRDTLTTKQCFERLDRGLRAVVGEWASRR